MNIYKLIHLATKNSKLLIAIPLLAAGLMYLLTSNQPRVYSTSASIFTAITAKSSLEDMGDSRVDFFATKTDYNNLLSILSSRSVLQETSLRLLASHLILDTAQANVISPRSFAELHKILPNDIKKLIVKNNANATYLNLQSYLKQDKKNFLYGLLNFDHPHYSYKAISNIKAIQDGGSDVVELTYQSNDAAIAYQTLSIFIKVFLKEYGELKKNQTNAVVEYFERQLKKASDMLNDSEERLLDFNEANSIINYYEQTKHISSQQEKIEVKLQEVLMEYEAAGAVLSKLEIETKARFNINLKTKEIMKVRQNLIAVNQKLATLEVEHGDSLFTTPAAHLLNEQREQLQQHLRDKLDSLYVYNNTGEALTLETLLNDWLKTVIEFESAKARLHAMQVKNIEFKKLYTQYAPLGAILKKIEREIDVREREYLEILHHLGLAKLKQQNEAMQSNMKIMDEPQLPIDTEPSKRKLFVIIIGLFGFIFTFFALIVFELLDKTIKSVDRFAQLCKLPVASALVNQLHSPAEQLKQLQLKGSKQLLEEIIKQQTTNIPVTVQILSNWNGEGKTYFINQLYQFLTEFGYQVERFNFSSTSDSKSDYISIVIKETYTHNSYDNLLKDQLKQTTQIVLIETPAMSNTIFNSNLYKSARLSYLLADATRTWSSADEHLLTNLCQQAIPNLQGIINRVHPDDLEDFVGEIQKKRSRVRIFIKQRIFKRFIS